MELDDSLAVEDSVRFRAPVERRALVTACHRLSLSQKPSTLVTVSTCPWLLVSLSSCGGRWQQIPLHNSISSIYIGYKLTKRITLNYLRTGQVVSCNCQQQLVPLNANVCE